MASTCEAALEALKAALGVNFPGTVYPPDLVDVVLFWPDEQALDSSLDTVYLIRPGRDLSGWGPDSGSVTDRLEVFVLAARRHGSASEDPFREDPKRHAVSVDLVADLREKLRRQDKLGGVVVELVDGPMAADHDRYVPGWVAPEVQFVIRYRHGVAER